MTDSDIVARITEAQRAARRWSWPKTLALLTDARIEMARLAEENRRMRATVRKLQAVQESEPV